MRELDYIKCPRCNFKNAKTSKSCSRCELNFEKMKFVTNSAGVEALKRHERNKVIWTKKLPSDLNKWRLFWTTLLLGWSGYHLWKVGKFARAIFHLIGQICFIIFIITFNLEQNVMTYNLTSISGAVFVITLILVVVDLADILFNNFKVPVSLPWEDIK